MSGKLFELKSGKILVIVLGAIVGAFLVTEELHAKTATHWVNNDATSYVPPGTGCVDAGYSTIQAAVNAASAGENINVCPGFYTENIVVSKNNLKIVGIGGAADTTVNAAASAIVFLVSAPGVTIDGFKIVPAGSADSDLAINLAVEGNANATFVNNVIVGGRIGINLGCASANSTVAYNIVDGQSEAAINIDTCEGSESGSDGNVVHHNAACGGIFSYSIAAGGKSDNNKIFRNAAMWMTVVGSGNKVHNNVAEYFDVSQGNTDKNNTIDLDVCPLTLCR